MDDTFLTTVSDRPPWTVNDEAYVVDLGGAFKEGLGESEASEKGEKAEMMPLAGPGATNGERIAIIMTAKESSDLPTGAN